MPKKPRDYRGELREVMNALAETVADASDEELLAEAQETGLDLEAEAESVRAVLRRSVEKFKRQKLEQARRDYELAASALSTRKYSLPETPLERRNLLTNILTAQPQMQGMLTVQFRELDQLSDEDIESSLRKLAELGILDDLSDKSNKE
ncbi:MAG TPA: hypothetical protein VHC97_22990 [Thermoanaerobaculia bacterium]|jgi:hypothetical protein|nr:hypothetical protein [Thermoanaerobaculia bacterium]